MGSVRIGYNVQSTTGNTVKMLMESRPGVLVWVDVAHRNLMQAVHSWGGLNIVRRYFPDGAQWPMVIDDPDGAAGYCADAVLQMYGPVWDLVDVALGFNEYWGSDKPLPGQIEAMVAYEMGMWNRMRQDANKPYGAISMPRGNPERDQWAYLMDVCRRVYGKPFCGDYFSSHNAYWWLPGGPRDRQSGYDPDAPFLIGREVHLLPRCPVPIIYTEMGYDSGHHTGFSKDYLMNDRDAVYAGHIKDWALLNAEIAEKYRLTIVGGAIFIIGENEVWRNYGFDCTGIYQIRDVVNAQPKEHTVYDPEPEPSTPQWVGAFAELAAEKPGIVGECIGQPQNGPGPGDVWQLGTKGMMRWDGVKGNAAIIRRTSTGARSWRTKQLGPF